jgi:hypothetical protein
MVEMLDASSTQGFQEKTYLRLAQTQNRTEYLRNSFFYLLAGNVRLALELQTQFDQTRVALALESFRLRHGQYPQNLDALIPQDLQMIPKDRSTMDPVRYSRPSPDHFELSSGTGESGISWQL